jgi:hypothetical protein
VYPEACSELRNHYFFPGDEFPEPVFKDMRVLKVTAVGDINFPYTGGIFDEFMYLFHAFMYGTDETGADDLSVPKSQKGHNIQNLRCRGYRFIHAAAPRQVFHRAEKTEHFHFADGKVGFFNNLVKGCAAHGRPLGRELNQPHTRANEF